MAMRKSVIVFQLISSGNWRFFFITIGEKASTNIPLSQMYHVRKGATLTRLYVPMYLNLDDYPPFSDKNRSFLRHILTETWDVFMDIPIALHILIWLIGYIKTLGKCYFLNFHKLENNSMSQENNLQDLWTRQYLSWYIECWW